MKYKVEQRVYGITLQTINTNSFNIAKRWYKSFYDANNCVALLWIDGVREKIPQADKLMEVLPQKEALSIFEKKLWEIY
jgi:hypothetical protein